jgi:hypothetical protein
MMPFALHTALYCDGSSMWEAIAMRTQSTEAIRRSSSASTVVVVSEPSVSA